MTGRSTSKRRLVVVGIGDGPWVSVAAACPGEHLGALAGGVVLSTFGGDAIGGRGRGCAAFGASSLCAGTMVVGWVGFRDACR